MIEYRSYTPADRSAVLRVLGEDMTAPQAAAKATTFDWQFNQYPHYNGRSPFLLGIVDGVVAAVQGLQPAKLLYKGTRKTGVWAVDAHVSVPFRRHGISTEMKRRLLKEADVALGYGMSDATNSILGRLGWQLSDAVGTYYFHVNEAGALGVLKNLRARLYRRPSRRSTSMDVVVESKPDFGSEVDALWERSAATWYSAVERDAAYLKWKYQQHPWIAYQSYRAHRKGQLAGILIARADPEMSVIVDYCGPLNDPDLLVELVNAAVIDLSATGTVRIYCQTSEPGITQALRLNGFRRSRGNDRLRIHCAGDPNAADRFVILTGDSDNDFTVPITQTTRTGVRATSIAVATSPPGLIEYRPCSLTERDLCFGLLIEGMTPAEATAKSATLEWQFAGNPHDDGRPPFLLGITNGVTIAVNAFMPARVIYKGTPRAAIWSCDSHVPRSLRGRGYGSQMMARVSHEAEIVLGYGLSDAMDVVLGRAKWELNCDLANYYFDVQERGVTGALKNLRGRLYRMRRQSPAADIKVSVNLDVDFGPEVDELWNSGAPTYFSAVVRDAAYLNWKYRRHPLLSYCWYSARRNERLRGVLIARPDPEVSVIVDYCGPLGENHVIADLIDAAIDDLSERGTMKIRCETTDPVVAAALRQNGFRESPGQYRFRVRSNLPDDVHPAERFFLMTGDSDNDCTVLFAPDD